MPPHSALIINCFRPLHFQPTNAMDFDFGDSVPETQMDWLALLNQADASLDFSLQLPPPPHGNNQAGPPPANAFFPVPAAPVPDAEQSVEAMKEMIFYLAALQPVRIDPELVKARPRRNVRISKDPQSVAARQRRERIGERIRILQQLVPGGSKMDTASMLEEAVRYLKFLKAKVRAMERVAAAGQVGGLNPYTVQFVSGGEDS